VPDGKARDLNIRLSSIQSESESNSAVKEVKQQTVRRGEVTHRVGRGETLSGIAARYDVSIREIRSWNKMKKDSVQVGQVLRIVK
jgi:LysM repeat protein